MTVTPKGAPARAFAAERPPKPAPTIATRGLVMARLPVSDHNMGWFRSVRILRCAKRGGISTGASMSRLGVPIAAIRGLITDALAAAGLPREDAAKCAELMGEADLTGADAHGVFRLPQYVRRLKAGGFNP